MYFNREACATHTHNRHTEKKVVKDLTIRQERMQVLKPLLFVVYYNDPRVHLTLYWIPLSAVVHPSGRRSPAYVTYRSANGSPLSRSANIALERERMSSTQDRFDHQQILRQQEADLRER